MDFRLVQLRSPKTNHKRWNLRHPPPPERQLAEPSIGIYRSTSTISSRYLTIKTTSISVLSCQKPYPCSRAAVSTGEVRELQVVLESQVVNDRLPQALLVLKRDLINMELGKGFEEELCKMQGLEPTASEANVTRNYSDWWTQIPWGRHTPEKYSITHAQTLFVNYVALFEGRLSASLDQRIQFGGLTDVAEIKGHIRTYVGTLPGSAQIIQALKRVETENPLVLNDEVDKIGCGINGDPARRWWKNRTMVSWTTTGSSSQRGFWLSRSGRRSRIKRCRCTRQVLLQGEWSSKHIEKIHCKPRAGARRRYLSPEPKQPGTFTTVDVGSKPIGAIESKQDRTPPEPVSALETREPPQNELISNHTTTTAPETDQKKPVTMKERKPMHVHADVPAVGTDRK
ncbi:hypothetical protein BYT27DRAFT_7255468 [Phlegmacium glaucopus]|nr:hypothetical protein BYT27DRAFT_7255468 [Phlegmacium glaucopus]